MQYLIPNICKSSFKISCSSVYSSMPLKTRNIAKGIPPRVHLPKSARPKPSAGKKDGATNPTKKGRKRHASTSGDDSADSEEQSGDLEPKAKKKRARREATTAEEEVEVLEEVDDGPVPNPPMEHINDTYDEQTEPPDEDEVSTDDYITQKMDQLTE